MTEATVFVFWGQSNMRGSGTNPPGDVPTYFQTRDQGVRVWNVYTKAIEYYHAGVNSDTINSGVTTPQKWGPEAQFTKLYRQQHGAEKIYILKYAIGGTQLGHTSGSDWLPSETAELFALTTTELNSLKARLTEKWLTPVVRAIVGMQGEADASTVDGGALAAAYQANKTAFYAAARTNWGDANTRFIDGRISTTARSPTLTYADTVRAAQVAAAAAEGNAAICNTDDLPLSGDALHFTAAGYVTLGERFYSAYDPLYGV